MANAKSSGRNSAPQQPPAGRQESVAPASASPEPTGPMLYEHRDGRYGIAPSPELATFTNGDPGWVRMGRISVVVPEPGDDSDKQLQKSSRKSAEVLDDALDEAMGALGEAEALFHAAGQALCTTGGPDADALIMVGQRCAAAAYKAASEASLAAIDREISHV